MKRLFLVLIGAIITCAGFAQTIDEGESAIIYYSPKTAVSLDITYTVETQEKGIYAQYADAMLGIADAVTANKTTYALGDVKIGTATFTDYSRPHKITPEKGIEMQLLHLNERNLLVGYNMPACTEKPQPRKGKETETTGVKSRIAREMEVPFPEEALEASTPLAQAHAVAKQIFHLRETRMYILSGEVEHAPADGTAMRLVLEELNRQEQALTELFTGKKSQCTLHQTLRIEPDMSLKDSADAVQNAFYFFSEENGFTDAENIDADSIIVRLRLHPQQARQLTEKEKKAKKAGATPSQIVYNLPGSGVVEVQFKGQTIATRTIPLAQLGIDVPLAKELFTGATLPVIVFNEKTGNIVSISK